MSDRAKDLLGGTVPRWATAIAMGLCALFLHRLLEQFDTTTAAVAAQKTQIAVMQAEGMKSSEVLAKLNDITRLLDQRLARLELKNPN